MAIKEITYNGNSFKISYEILNPSSKKDIIFLHGWGSDKEVSKLGFKHTIPSFRHIYIDMPGFGKSTNDTILTTDNYYEIMKLFLTDIGARLDVVVGHSFGGKVATLLKPKLLVLLSSAGIVPTKSFKVRFKIKLFKFLKPLGVGRFYKLFASKDVDNMSQNMYETFKNVVDEVFNQEFQNYQGKTLIFWGKQDTATPLLSGKTIHNLINKSKFYPLLGDHYFFLNKTNSNFIAKEIDDNY
ncbi:MAG TPA: alpha/beta hydrolase [Campylobacterales bacterium]|nr:alpha/beta hydrolase [Campylobacterales bacterium]